MPLKGNLYVYCQVTLFGLFKPESHSPPRPPILLSTVMGDCLFLAGHSIHFLRLSNVELFRSWHSTPGWTEGWGAANLHFNFDIWQWKALRAVMWCEHNKPVPVVVPVPVPGQYPLPLCSQCSEVCEVPQSQTGQNLIQTMRNEDLTQRCVWLYLAFLRTIHWLPIMKEQWGKLS